jgi:hypothetical protein
MGLKSIVNTFSFHVYNFKHMHHQYIKNAHQYYAP